MTFLEDDKNLLLTLYVISLFTDMLRRHKNGNILLGELKKQC